LKLLFAGGSQRIEREQNQRIWTAWHVAAFGRMKKMPPLDRVMNRMTRSRPRQSWQEQFQIMKMWAAKQQQAIEMRKADGG
jgi:hypothetical protein